MKGLLLVISAFGLNWVAKQHSSSEFMNSKFELLSMPTELDIIDDFRVLLAIGLSFVATLFAYI